MILFVAANPLTTSRLAFDEECAAIERELRMTAGRDDFDFRSKWAVTADELMRHLNELRPTIIHFSGHGRSRSTVPTPPRAASPRASAVRRGDEVEGGLYFQDEYGRPQIVTGHALRMMIKAASVSTRVVLLNACYSVLQANALRTVVDCVIGMTGAICDDAARSFAVAFYRALGNRRSVGNAVEQAVAILAVKQLPAAHLPRCRTRKGINAAEILLTSTAGAVVGAREDETCRT